MSLFIEFAIASSIGNVDPKFAAENLMVYIGQAGTWLVPYSSVNMPCPFQNGSNLSYKLLILGLQHMWTNVELLVTISWHGLMMVGCIESQCC